MVVKKAGVDAEYGSVEYGEVDVKKADRDQAEYEARNAGYREGQKVEIVRLVDANEAGSGPSALQPGA